VNEIEQADKRIENTLFYVSLFSFAYFYQASDQSTAARFDLIRSVLERRTLWIDGFCGYNTADIINIQNHYYSVKAPGTSLTGLLPWSLISWMVSIPLAAAHESLMWVILTYLTIVISISLPVALLVVVMYRFGKALGATPGRSAAIALLMAFATILFPYATEMTGEPVAAVCLMTSFYLVFTAAKNPDYLRAGFAGFLAGWAVLGDFPSLLVAAAIGIYSLRKLPKWRHVFSFALGAAIARSTNIDAHLHVQGMLAELIQHAEFVRAAIRASEADAAVSPASGLMTPAEMPLWTVRMMFPKMFVRMCEIIQILGAGGLVAVPSYAELAGPAAADVATYFQAANADAATRIKLFRLAFDAAVSSFSGRQQLYERYYSGDPVRLAGTLYGLYDKDTYIDRIAAMLDELEASHPPPVKGEG